MRTDCGERSSSLPPICSSSRRIWSEMVDCWRPSACAARVKFPNDTMVTKDLTRSISRLTRERGIIIAFLNDDPQYNQF